MKLVVAAAGAVALGAVGVFQMSTWDRVARGVVALGTPVGGLTEAETVSKLAPKIDALLGRPLQIRYGEQRWDATARDLGLRLDPSAVARDAYRVGRDGNPIARMGDQLDALRGGRGVALSATTDQAVLDQSIARIAREVERPARDATLQLTSDGRLQYSESRVGLTVDGPATRARLAEVLAAGTGEVELAVREVAPAVPTEALAAARQQLERIVGDGVAGPPLTLTFGQQSWPLTRADVGKLLSVEGGTSKDQPAIVKIDEQPLQALAQQRAKELNQDVRDARLLWNGGALKPLVESREGRTVDVPGTVALIKAKLLSGERTAELPVTVVQPAVSSANPQALGIVEKIDGGSTSFAGSIPEKKFNIALAAERLNGVVVPPGGTFSFNKSVGPTTLDAGFKWGFGITNGASGPQTVPSVAGGICQVATTLFQPVFWAGYALEERYAHSYWIPAYTSRNVIGLDAAVAAEANLDFQWVNTTKDYVLIQAATDEERVYFGLYGKKPTWKVEVSPEKITNRTPADPKPVVQAEPTLPWGRTLQVESARDGFEVVVTRKVTSPDGSTPRELDLKTVYQPSRTVTLVGTANKPADVNTDDALARVLGGQRPDAPAAPRATTVPQASATPAAAQAPAVNATPQVGSTPAPSAPAVAPAPKPPAPTTQPTASARAAATPPAASTKVP